MVPRRVKPWTPSRRPASRSGLGYNRRWHPEMTKLRNMIDSGELGVILHVEATMTFPNALLLKADAWRASERRRRAAA